MTISIARIKKPQLIGMLEYLGVPYNEQPKVVNEKRHVLEKYMKLDAVKFNEAYSIIVLHKIPKALEGDNNALAARDISQMVANVWESEVKNITSRVDVATKSKLGELEKVYAKAAQAAIEEAKKQFVTHHIKVGNKKAKKVDGVLPAEFDRLCALAVERVNTLMVGPAGCGKTYVAAKVAEAIDLPFASQSCSEGVSESVFTGWLLPIGDGGSFEYIQSEFIRVYENGGVFLLDEMDAADPNVLVFLNNALANTSFTLPQRYNKPTVVKHKDFHAIGAANTFGNGADVQYVGRTQLDASTLDRFRIGTVAMDYDSTVEEALINPDVLEWGRTIRSAIKQHGFNRIMSTRNMLDATAMVDNQNYIINDISKGYFADWSREERTMLGGVL